MTPAGMKIHFLIEEIERSFWRFCFRTLAANCALFQLQSSEFPTKNKVGQSSEIFRKKSISDNRKDEIAVFPDDR